MSSIIILMVGIPGSGKTFLAKSLSKKLNCEFLNRDLIRTSIFPKKYIDHSKLQNNIAFEVLFKVLKQLISNNKPEYIIVDGKPFSKNYEIEEFKNEIDKLSAKLIIIHVTASIDIISSRLQNDLKNQYPLYRDPKKNSKIYNTQLMINEFDKIIFPHIIIDTSSPIKEVTKNCFNKINEFIK